MWAVPRGGDIHRFDNMLFASKFLSKTKKGATSYTKSGIDIHISCLSYWFVSIILSLLLYFSSKFHCSVMLRVFVDKTFSILFFNLSLWVYLQSRWWYRRRWPSVVSCRPARSFRTSHRRRTPRLNTSAATLLTLPVSSLPNRYSYVSNLSNSKYEKIVSDVLCVPTEINTLRD